MQRWTIGNARITQVVEMGQMPTSPRFFFADPPSDLVARHAWLRPHFARDDGKLLMSIHAFVIESCGKRIVVDTCVGNDKARESPAWNRLNGPFLSDLAAAGFAAESIDLVLCTHLHVDHVGWNTRWDGSRWLPTFPNARYLFARKEWEHWSREQSTGYDGDQVIADSVQPIVDAGIADLVDVDHRLTDEVRLEPTPGHTPGHVSVRIDSAGVNAVITGDLMHHPIQCAEPDMPVRFDSDGAQARATRRTFLACCARDRSLVFGTHFALPTAGRVAAHGDAWRFVVDAAPGVVDSGGSAT
jgi:glyoxylase-like metal-dependent hydrolase (beta-lactamase superfamily II)